MSQELMPQSNNQAAFMGGRGQMPSTVNAGAVAIEQERAIAEAQGQLILAKKFPRELNSAHAELMTACKSPAFAAQAFYSVPNRGSGPSIRFAEEVARVYGNFQYGHRELSRGDGKSEVEVFAWDMQNNNRSIRQITVLHVLDSRSGSRKLNDQADIDNKIANVASKQIRGRILALMPKWLVADAIEECKKTLAGDNSEPLAVRVRKMTGAFSQFGVTTKHLEAYLGHKLDDVLLDELVDLQGVFNALREGTPASEFFGAAEAEEKANEAAESLANTAKTGAAQGNKPAASAEKPKGNSGQGKGNNVKATPAAEAVSTDPQPADEPEQAQTETQPDAVDTAPGGDESDVF